MTKTIHNILFFTILLITANAQLPYCTLERDACDQDDECYQWRSDIGSKCAPNFGDIFTDYALACQYETYFQKQSSVTG